jgi:hypothetical protein
MIEIVPIVEGHGEQQAVPALLRRLGLEFRPSLSVKVLRPIRRSRDRLVLPGELEKDVEYACSMLEGRGAVLILLDADTDCPAALGRELVRRAKTSSQGMPVSVSLAKTEYECWFLAAADSLRGKRGLAMDLTAPADPEAIRGAKEWLRDRMPGSRTYRETVDQVALTELMDLNLARRSPSFARFCRVYQDLLDVLAKLQEG